MKEINQKHNCILSKLPCRKTNKCSGPSLCDLCLATLKNCPSTASSLLDLPIKSSKEGCPLGILIRYPNHFIDSFQYKGAAGLLQASPTASAPPPAALQRKFISAACTLDSVLSVTIHTSWPESWNVDRQVNQELCLSTQLFLHHDPPKYRPHHCGWDTLTPPLKAKTPPDQEGFFFPKDVNFYFT